VDREERPKVLFTHIRSNPQLNIKERFNGAGSFG
jgi:hypothetical protein